MHFIIQSPFAALPPQILPPKDCDCGGSLGHAIRRHRAHQQKQIDLWEAAGYRGNKTAVMLYAFSGSIVQADGSLSGQAQYNGDASTKPPTMADPVVASSLSSLARVTTTTPVHLMACPTAAHTFGLRASSMPAVTRIVPCGINDLATTRSKGGGCFTSIVVSIQIELMFHAALSLPGVERLVFVETDMLWLGPPLAAFAQWRSHSFDDVTRSTPASSFVHGEWVAGPKLTEAQRAHASRAKAVSLEECDLILTIVGPKGGLNSGILLAKRTEAVRILWAKLLDATIERASKQCLGGQNQGALFDLLGLPFMSDAFKAFMPGTSVLSPDGSIRACAISYERATLAPMVVEKRHERVPCPGELLLGHHHSGMNQTVMHLKAANRAPSHQHALRLLHDCVTAAEFEALRAAEEAGAAMRMVREHLLWAHHVDE